MPSSPFGPSERAHGDALTLHVLLASCVVVLVLISELANGAFGPLDPSGTSSAPASTSSPVTPAVVPPSFPVVFSEAGLPPGMNWSATLNGVTASATSGSAITFQEPVGTYSFSVGRVPGYSPDPSSGKVAVTAPSVSLTITFSAISTTAPSGLPVLSATTGYLLLGGLVALVVVVVVVELALRSRHRRQPVESEAWASP